MKRVRERDVPCDFDAFVAERRGLTSESASALIATWLADYEPLERLASGARSAERPAAPRSAA
jgi:hypothetical protein